MKHEARGGLHTAPIGCAARSPGEGAGALSCAATGALWGGCLGALLMPAALAASLHGVMPLSGAMAEVIAGTILGALAGGGIAGALSACGVVPIRIGATGDWRIEP